MPVGHIWEFDLDGYEIRSFGMKFNFSKIRIEPVMLNFLATTENIRNKIRTTELQLRKIGRKKQREIAIRNFRDSSKKNTRVELSYLDIGDRAIKRADRNPTEPE